MQRMAGTIQLVSNFEWRLTSVAGLQVIDNDLEMPGGFLRENIEKHRIHFQCRPFLFGDVRRLFDCEHGCIGVAFGESARACHQQAYVAVWLGTDLQLLDQLRNGGGGLQYEVHHRRCANQRAVD